MERQKPGKDLMKKFKIKAREYFLRVNRGLALFAFSAFMGLLCFACIAVFCIGSKMAETNFIVLPLFFFIAGICGCLALIYCIVDCISYIERAAGWPMYPVRSDRDRPYDEKNGEWLLKCFWCDFQYYGPHGTATCQKCKDEGR